MALVREERAYERYAWMLLFVLGAVSIFFASTSLVGGTSSTSNAFPDAVEFAVPIIGWGVLIMAISAVSYRRGDRWAWYASWSLPLAWAALAAHDLLVGGNRASFAFFPIILLVIALLGLLLPYKKFFPIRQD